MERDFAPRTSGNIEIEEFVPEDVHVLAENPRQVTEYSERLRSVGLLRTERGIDLAAEILL